MHCHLPANHWLVGSHRVLSRNAERLVVDMVTLQVIKCSFICCLSAKCLAKNIRDPASRENNKKTLFS